MCYNAIIIQHLNYGAKTIFFPLAIYHENIVQNDVIFYFTFKQYRAFFVIWNFNVIEKIACSKN